MKTLPILIALLFALSSLQAKVTLPPLFTDHMVLQQQSQVPVWGSASAGKKVEITTSWDNQKYTVTSDAQGKWGTHIQTPAAGGPYQITISDGKKITLSDVLIGEVWVCSGQSNMEMPLAGWGKVLNYETEIATANFPKIRLLQVEKATSTQPVTELKIRDGGWQVCSPATIPEFSSVGYFFGRHLYENIHVPIGLINTSWGGTIAEAWASGKTLENMPYFKESVEEIRTQPTGDNLAQTYDQKIKEWNDQILAADAGYQNKVPVWNNPKLDDSGWSDMLLPGYWEEKGMTDFDGIVWFRKTVNIPTDWKGKVLELKLGKIDDNDITFFNGVKIGETNFWDADRVYKIPADLVKPGKAIITVRVMDTSGNGGFHGNKEDMKITVPNDKLDGKTSIGLADGWKYKIAVDMKNYPKQPQSPINNPNRPTVLYNAMIRPLVPYAIRGAIWYQGESNADRAYQYRELFPLMISDWRTQWNSDFPFYFVQLANFMEIKAEPQESNWAELREAQMKTLQLQNTGMAVTIDIGDAKDIHPKNKQDVGIRLALAARANTYKQNVEYSGPLYESYRIENGKIRISFTHTQGGLKIKNDPALTGFAIAGQDHVFHWAEAVIEGNEVVVRSPKVPYPVAVRYAWADNPVCNLFNGAGLPASPFRTDDWIKGK